MKISAILIIYFLYAFAPNGFAILIPLIPFIYGVRLSSSVERSFTYFMFYISTVFVYSFSDLGGRNLYNIVSSSKIIFLILFAIFSYSSKNMFYDSFDELKTKYLRFFLLFLFLGIVIYSSWPHLRLFGMRGDVGVFVALLLFPFAIDVVKRMSYSNISIFFLLVLFSLVFLFLLQGRTALGSVATSIFFAYLLGVNLRGRVNIFAFILIVLAVLGSVGVGVFLIFSRGGIEYILESEARVLAAIFWFDVMTNSNILQILLGHGFGFCANEIVPGSVVVSQHVAQIMKSSGHNCYVSWGFHNTILSSIYEIGVVGFGLFLYIFFRCVRRNTTAKRLLTYFIVSVFLISSPNNHLMNNDLLGTLLFGALGYLRKPI